MKNTNIPYAPIHLRSYFSLLRGPLSPETLCDVAAGMGSRIAGIADINNVYGMVRFVRAADRQGLKPVISAALEWGGKYRLTAVCRSPAGFARLNRVLTALFSNEDTDPLELFCSEGWDGLALISPYKRILARLRRTGRRDLYAALFYGIPFRKMLLWAREQGIPCVALNNGVYTQPEEASLFRTLRAVDENTTIDRLPPGTALQPMHRIVSAGEMARFFSAAPEALRNAWRLAESCSGRLLPESYVFPRFEEMGEEDAYRRLRGLCEAGVRRRYGRMRPDIGERISYELSIIREKGFSGYFLVVHDIVRRCPRTCGRGSSAASIVAFLLGITHVDPLRYNLFFERFLNEGRKDPPDIDVDFPWDERQQALSYVFSKYKGHSGMVADHVTFGPRSSLRDPAKAFGIEEEEIAQLLGCLRRGEQDRIPEYLFRTVQRLRGMPRHIGMHPGGVVITPGPVTDYTHLQPSPAGLPVIAWEKDAAEEAGLVKIDLLGNRSLGVLRDTITLVNRRRKNPITWESFQPLDSTETRQLIERGDTLGVFYVESPATRQLLKKMGRGEYENLVIASSIIRPAANRFIGQFVRRLKGAPYEPLHPLVDEPLRETMGIMVYQEDVARVAIAAAGFTAWEADSLRKVLSKRDREIRLQAYKERFFTGCGKNGVGRPVIEKLWEMIRSFDGYSFCKAHSASYALVSYRLAWLKHYYPLEFFASVINNGGGFYSAQVYLNEIRRMGFPILPPDVNKSGWKHTVEGCAFRLGFCQIRDVPEEFLHRLLAERAGKGEFTDFFDFLRRIRPLFPVMRMMIRCGSLDSVAGGMTRPEMFWIFFHARGQDELFGPPRLPSSIGDYAPVRKLHDEIDTLGLCVSCHPLAVFRHRADRLARTVKGHSVIDSRKLAAHIGFRIAVAGILVTGKEVRTGRKQYMGFFSFDDPYGVFETVLFPGRYDELLRVLDQGRAFLVCGTVAEEFGVPIIEVQDLLPLASDSAALPFRKESSVIYRY